MPQSLLDEIAARVRRLPRPQQEQALAYVRTLERGDAQEQTTGPAALARFAGAIAPAELAVMAAAIEADCERVDAAGW